MEKVVISILGQDRPGIIAAVTGVLYETGCNIENVSQTILQSEFSGIFIAGLPAGLTPADLRRKLQAILEQMDLHVTVKTLRHDPKRYSPVPSEPFVITTRGPDQKGLVARITAVMARHQVNVTDLQAVFKGGEDPNHNVMIYEVDIPRNADPRLLCEDLRSKARELGLEISIQHRQIFEVLNRI